MRIDRHSEEVVASGENVPEAWGESFRRGVITLNSHPSSFDFRLLTFDFSTREQRHGP
jgi:hypothetical protein